jgi:uncharacterized membrane protein
MLKREWPERCRSLFSVLWGYKLLAYTNLAAGVCEIPMLAYTKSPEKAKASLF